MGKSADEDVITLGNGNVFADLGLENPEERLAKAPGESDPGRSRSARLGSRTGGRGACFE